METQEIIKTEYEIAYLVRIEEDAQIVASAIASHRGEVKSEVPLKRIALSYKIKKETQAVLGVVRFMMEPEMAVSLAKVLRTNNAILRFLVTKAVSIASTTPMRPFRSGHSGGVSRPQMGERKTPAFPATAPFAPSAPLSNEALEKKIEEILQ